MSSAYKEITSCDPWTILARTDSAGKWNMEPKLISNQRTVLQKWKPFLIYVNITVHGWSTDFCNQQAPKICASKKQCRMRHSVQEEELWQSECALLYELLPHSSTTEEAIACTLNFQCRKWGSLDAPVEGQVGEDERAVWHCQFPNSMCLAHSRSEDRQRELKGSTKGYRF